MPPNAGPDLKLVAALDGAIAAAFPSFGSLAKDGDNTYLKTSYLTLPSLLDAVRPALMAQGVLVTSSLRLVPGGFVCQTTLQHSSGGWRTSQFPVGDPSNAQRVAAAATYGLRINLQQLLAVCGTDDDGQSVDRTYAVVPPQHTPGMVQQLAPGQSYEPPMAQQPAPQPWQQPQQQQPPAPLPAAPQPAPAPYV
jgi:hypothetical protein